MKRPWYYSPHSERRAAILETDQEAAKLARRLMNRMIRLKIITADDDPECRAMASALIARIDAQIEQ